MTSLKGAMNKCFLFFLLAALIAGPAWAQSQEEMRQGRQRGWTPQQVKNWLDYYANQPFRAQAGRRAVLARVA